MSLSPADLPAAPVWTVVVAAGSGDRFGGPKQYERLAGRRVLDHSLSVARLASDGVVLVVDAARVDDPEPLATRVVAGGATRSASVRSGLAAVPPDAAIVLVHDGARPAATHALFLAVIDAVRAGHDSVVPAVPVADTLKRVDSENRIVGTLERSGAVAVQTPQGFRAAVIRQAHAAGTEATDDAGLVESLGGEVVVVPGDPTNLKVTTPDDLARLEVSLAPARRAAGFRIGHGVDRHLVSDDPDRPMVLGGVVHEGGFGLVGHSDADAVAHAVADAALAGAGLPDLGALFPDTDPTLSGADSIELLTEVGRRIRAAGWRVVNADCTVVCDRPKVAPRRSEMEARLSAAVGGTVTVKGTRPEGFGSLGRNEGVEATAVVLLMALGEDGSNG